MSFLDNIIILHKKSIEKSKFSVIESFKKEFPFVENISIEVEKADLGTYKISMYFYILNHKHDFTIKTPNIEFVSHDINFFINPEFKKIVYDRYYELMNKDLKQKEEPKKKVSKI